MYSPSEELIHRMHTIQSLPVIRGYFLVLGGGNVGHNFLEHAKKKSIPLVIVIDKDPDAMASNDLETIFDMGTLAAFIGNATRPQAHASSAPLSYFHRMDVSDVFSLLMHGLPEFIIPAVPSHAAADIVVSALGSDLWGFAQGGSVGHCDGRRSELFLELVSVIPKEILAGSCPEQGTIFLSYAQKGEICPDNCAGPEGYCPTFARKKPLSIASHAREATLVCPGQVFESIQLKPGIGGIRGSELRDGLISAMSHACAFTKGQRSCDICGAFFVATACNCHGIISVLPWF